MVEQGHRPRLEFTDSQNLKQSLLRVTRRAKDQGLPADMDRAIRRYAGFRLLSFTLREPDARRKAFNQAVGACVRQMFELDPLEGLSSWVRDIESAILAGTTSLRSRT